MEYHGKCPAAWRRQPRPSETRTGHTARQPVLTRSRGPIGGLRGYMTPVAAYGGSPGLLRCGTYQDIGADHAARQEPEGRRYVAPVGPIRLQLALEVVYEGRSRLQNGDQVRTCG